MPNAFQWSRCCKLTFDHTKISSDIVNLPICLVWTGSALTSSLPLEMFDADGGHPAKADGGDVRVSMNRSGSNEIPIEIVKFNINNDPSLVKGEIHCLVPFISSSVDTVIYLWWGNSGASLYSAGATFGKNAVWSDYASVYHLGETAGATCFDSAAAANNGTFQGTLPRFDPGLAGSGQSFIKNNSDWISVPSISTPNDLLSVLSVRKFDDATSPFNPVEYAKTTGTSIRDFVLRVNTTGPRESFLIKINSHLYFEDSLDIASVGWGLSAGTWDHSFINSYFWQGSAHDGLQRHDAATSPLDNDSIASAIGVYPAPASGSYWQGIIDEIRISATKAFSLDYFKATYFLFSAPNSIISVSSPFKPYKSQLIPELMR